ncbi:MAG: hypothetical protein JOZ49_00255 [Mycolicibacterium sp.]|nr:hypothetical protein [Mycolicibacterium sp.]
MNKIALAGAAVAAPAGRFLRAILDNGVYREWAWKMAIKRIVVVILSSVISPKTPRRSA